MTNFHVIGQCVAGFVSILFGVAWILVGVAWIVQAAGIKP